MVKYFGVNIRDKVDGLKLTKDNYIKVNPKSTFIKGKIYTELEINKKVADRLYNYDLNMNYFSSLGKDDFNEELKNFASNNETFIEITDLAPLSRVSGYYVMVLEEYKQVYIGSSQDIRVRILSHWSKQKEFDRLIFGRKEDSILSIDSFRAYDTTRIFVYPTDNYIKLENDFINAFSKEFVLNRTSGGVLLDLTEAIMERKTRNGMV